MDNFSSISVINNMGTYIYVELLRTCILKYILYKETILNMFRVRSSYVYSSLKNFSKLKHSFKKN